jgi:hypothetical protein
MLVTRTPRSLDGLRVLIVAVDWHGDVAPELAEGFELLGALSHVVYSVRQRRTGLRARLTDELLRTARFGPALRDHRLRRAEKLIADAYRRFRPQLTVCLTPDTLSRRSAEELLGGGPVCWWFGDDPRAFERRGLAGRPPVLDLAGEPGGRSFVAHPNWATGALASADYLPYASTAPRAHAAISDRRIRYPFITIGSPRPERARILGELYELLAPQLHVWGWGPRGRLGLNPEARSFRPAMCGWHTLSRAETSTIYSAAGVVLNLQDAQMIGAWNPQTFDVLGTGVPQVVWNRNPVALLQHPPPVAYELRDLAERALHHLKEPSFDQVIAAHEEVRARHRWHHRAAELASGGSTR